MLKTIDCNSDTFRLALYTTPYAAGEIDGADPAYSATSEIVASGYTATGESIGVAVVTQDDTNNWGKWDDDGSDVLWTSLAASSPRMAKLYDDTTATKWLAIVWEIATDSNGGNYTLSFHANGMMTIS